ncbi:MAG: hypothetical protein FJW86_01615 [Actinobacteria bacterium]|nr:hypothetical protein [Actinomycetota bacterium]
MGKRNARPLPTEFHGVSIVDGRLRYGEVDAPLAGVRVLVRDETTTERKVTASGLADAAVRILATDQIDWSFRQPVARGTVVLVVAGRGFAFEVSVDARERTAAKEFAVAVRVAVKAAEAAG